MLTAFSLENYRAFAERTTVELRPLTLLFGYNNAGKSSLIRALALIADSARVGARGVLDLSSEAARECDFDDLRSQVGGREGIGLGLEFQEGDRIEAQIAQVLRARRLIVSELRIHRELVTGTGPSTIIAQWTPTGHGAAPGYEISVDGSPAGEAELQFRSLAPSMNMAHTEGEDQPRRREHAESAFRDVARLVHAMGLHFQWLGSLRRWQAARGDIGLV